jgi:Tol biopolymer transport system component
MKMIFQACIALAVTAQFVSVAAVVSPPNASSKSAGGNSYNLGFSRNSQHLIFVSHANNLVTNDDPGLWQDVFVRDLVTSNTMLVSVSTNGVGGANADATLPTISSNGQFLAFASRASNLAPGTTNYNFSQIFVRDLLAGTTRVASVSTNGNPAILGGDSPSLSENGRWVAFESASDDLVAVPPADSVDVFVRDLVGNSNLLVSVTANGIGAAFGEKSYSSVISPSGRHVAFLSTVRNLPIGSVRPASSAGDVYVRDLQLRKTIWVSTNVSTIITNDGYRCSNPALSDDGRFAAFYAIPLTNSGTFVLRHDLQTGSTLILSTTATNVNHGLQISSDGGRVLFEESVDGLRKVRLWDASAGTNLNIGCDSGGDSRNAFMTPDGARVVFVACSNIYVVTVATGSSVLVSADAIGTPLSNGFDLTFPTISPDGSNVSFDHLANDLVPGDFNNASDIFVQNVDASVTELITKACASRPATTAFAHSFLGPKSISGDGRFIVSTRYDDPSFFRDTNGWRDVYLHDTVTGLSQALSIDTNLYFSDVGGASFHVENTNMYHSANVSADGSTVAAVRGSPAISFFGSFSARQDVVWTSGSNGVFGSGMLVANQSDTGGGIGNGFSFAPSLSADGRVIVFTTTSSDLVAGTTDNNGVSDVVLRRKYVDSNGLWTASNYLVSISLSGTAGNGASSNAIISPDGRWVVFQSRALDLVAPSPTGVWNLFARDVWSNSTHFIASSIYASTVFQFSISESSHYVPFLPDSSSLYVHDLLLRTNTLVSSGPGSLARIPSITTDGRLVAHLWRENSLYRIRVSDLVNHHTEILAESSGLWGDPMISPNGRYVVFPGNASAVLVAGDTNRSGDIFVRDRLLGTTMAITVNGQGYTANGSSTRPVLSADGRSVVFQSFASDLASGDYNDKRDIFVLKLGSPDMDGDGMDDDWEIAYFGNLSRDGTGDFDSDGATDYSEFIAGTDPTNNNSLFRVLTVTPVGGGSKVLFWTGNPTRNYRAEFKDGLASSNWSTVDGPVSWNGFTASITDGTASGASNRFYRVVRLP